MDGKGRTRRIATRVRQMLDNIRLRRNNRQRLVERLHDAEERNVIDLDTVGMMEGALLVSEMQVRDIMVPRSEIVSIEEDLLPEDFLGEIIESGHSRFPVYDDKREHVIGILLAKDMLSLVDERRNQFNIRDIIRPVVFVPESKRLSILLREFRERRNHLAIVVDEYGGISGLVTIEDVLEQIVGEIDDEHDLAEDDNIKRHRDERYTVKARTSIEEFNDFFGTSWQPKNYETVGGLIVHQLGHLPLRGEEVEFSGFEFKVLRADRRRIRLARVIRIGSRPDKEPVN